ncbi:MAG: hypothetical protein HQM12_01965 [SAR324 cluster bacterium]|nr:hypothetical protein [SAR324 cluster bacterium]MBF0352151.1 hypothetical protein [SAR324 cluster bacterium]
MKFDTDLINDNVMVENFESVSVENGLEDAILEYAIDTFPYRETFSQIPGHKDDEYRETLSELIDAGVLKVGFYYEEMQENLIIFYFLQCDEENYLVIGLDPEKVRVNIPGDVEGVFRLDDEQYLDMLQMPLV